MALIHYYKFNGNLYDSIGAFDLLADFGTPTYTTGKLGGSTGAVTSTIGSMYIFGCSGTGAAASGFLAADTTEAAAGVSAWSMTGWVYCSGTSTQIINLLSSTSGQSSAYLQYDQKFGGLTFLASGVSCSTGTWVFFTVRVTGGTAYLSVNGGSESSSAWNTGSGTGGKTQFNGIRIGSPSLYIALYARVDDVRVFNHSLSSGEIAGIYNAGIPAEATARTSNYLNAYRHFKYNSLPYDTSGNSPSINSVVFAGSLSYSSGIAANTNQSGTITTTSPGTPAQLACSNSDFLKSTGRNDTDSFAYFLWMSNTTGLYGNLNLGSFILEPNANNLKVFTAGGGLTNITISNGYALHKGFIYDGIAKRFSYYENSQLVAHKDGALDYISYYPTGFYANGASSGASVFNIDDVRFYGVQASGIEALDIYNSGAGTEASTVSGAATGAGATVTMTAPAGAAIVPTNGAATGGGATITMVAPTVTATGGTAGSATGAGATVTMTAPAGAAIIPTNGSATGSGATITMTAPAGIAFTPVNGSATGTGATIIMVAPAGLARTSWITEPISAVTMVPPEGRVQIGAETIGPTILVTIPPAGLGAGGGSASGTGRTVTLSAPAGSASGRAAGAGAIGTVALSALVGSATGSAPASGALATIPVTAPTGGATGTATKAAGLATVTVTTTTGSAIGTAAASGALATIAVSTTAGSASGTAAATGAGRTVAVSAPAGTLTASATTAGSLATITVAAPTATRTGGATASPAGVTVTVAAPAGGSIGTATGTGAISTATMTAPGGAARVSVSAAGSLPVVAMTTAAGAATGTASTTGGGAAVAMTAPAGVARASVVVAGAPGTVTMTATAGSATGTLTAPLATIAMVAPTGAALAIARGTGNIGTVTMTAAAGSATGILTAPIGTITMVAPAGTARAIVYGIGALGTVTITAPGAGTITANATGSPSGVTVSVIAPAARVAPITTGGGASVSTYDLRRAGTNL